MPDTRKLETARSRRLRRTMTDAEKRLWWHLKRVPTEHTHFRRQAAIGPYVVDFACHRARLVIEVDGAQHGFEPNRRSDLHRTWWLEEHGYRVLRFWNHEVTTQVDVVLDTVFAHLYTAHPAGEAPAPPPPTPPHKGEGSSTT